MVVDGVLAILLRLRSRVDLGVDVLIKGRRRLKKKKKYNLADEKHVGMLGSLALPRSAGPRRRRLHHGIPLGLQRAHLLLSPLWPLRQRRPQTPHGGCVHLFICI